jgi:hypothetical protein
VIKRSATGVIDGKSRISGEVLVIWQRHPKSGWLNTANAGPFASAVSERDVATEQPDERTNLALSTRESWGMESDTPNHNGWDFNELSHAHARG